MTDFSLGLHHISWLLGVKGKGVKGHRGSRTTTAATITTTSTSSGTSVVPDFQSGPLTQQLYLMVPNPGYTGLPPLTWPTPGCMGPLPPPLPISIPSLSHNSSILVDSETLGSSSTSPPSETASVPNVVIKQILVPDGKTSWLSFPPGSQKITEIIKKRYDKPSKKFGDVPLLTKKLWFKEWKSHFFIDDDDEEFFWRAFKYRTSKRFSQMMSDIREGVDTTHEWLIPAYKKVLEKYWKTDEKWKNIRKKARENRASLLGGSVHCGGSIPLSSTIERMKKQLDRTPTHEEVFKETHTLKSDKSKWVDKCSQDTHAKKEKLKRKRWNEAYVSYYKKVRASSSSTTAPLPPPPPPPSISSDEDYDDDGDEDDTEDYS
ncbi:hypothetical protein Ahy_B06g083101 [Arachis hypogaea]|uniref:Uncharacterized protein n=1 Tax=Arachis hypogaea TaxID=3818 RepID=A0A444YPF0_ARAHY|nr:hypothetical protein Ahy_B06g083101 [Arachis hypogaea]